MSRFLCVHGHFYQPPRENPWLEAIEQQESAYPYHDWNERVTAECYAPNAHARILGVKDRIIQIVNNYAHISFNFGPTVIAWLAEHDPELYARILEADQTSLLRLGHGSALAQAYNHLIMPLANARDRRTQVIWGLRDFASRFGRAAEGMWLPETAVDTPTLETLAELGVRFTILAPRQAAAVRPIGDGAWIDVSGGRVDPRKPYQCTLPSGRTIALFFYDGPVSQAVAFEGLLQSGESLVRRLTDIFNDTGDSPQLAHIATDGETYGHHHRHGEMALAWALRQFEIGSAARLTNYATFLAAHPPREEVRIVERSSWSCVHGVERWRSDCGCSTGGRPGWNQAWRAPLRAALDWLRDSLMDRFETEAGSLLHDPWAARDAYIDVILDRSVAALAAFLDTHARTPPDHTATVRILELMEIQRHAMLMYTSCGWFFNDVSGIETVQVLQYAARAAELARKVWGEDPEPELLRRLESARSNIAGEGNARRVYEERVRPARVDLMQVAAHRLVSAVFNGGVVDGPVYCYEVHSERRESRSADGATLAVGQASVRSRITRESVTVSYAILHFGNRHLSGGIRRSCDEAAEAQDAAAMLKTFTAGDMPRLLQQLEAFPEFVFSLKSLFADRQREILHRMLEARVQSAGEAFREVYESNADLMRDLVEQELPVPRALTLSAEFVLNRDLRRSLEPEHLDLARTRSLLEAARDLQVPLDREGLSFAAARALETAVRRLGAEPSNMTLLEQVAELVLLIESLPFEVELWAAQNAFYDLVENALPEVRVAADAGQEPAARWLQLFRVVGNQLAVAVA